MDQTILLPFSLSYGCPRKPQPLWHEAFQHESLKSFLAYNSSGIKERFGIVLSDGSLLVYSLFWCFQKKKQV
jgi:hypothetical protein